MHGTKNIILLICVCVCLYIRITTFPPFFGQVPIYSKPIKVKDEMFYVTFKPQVTWNAYRVMRVCVEF